MKRILALLILLLPLAAPAADAELDALTRAVLAQPVAGPGTQGPMLIVYAAHAAPEFMLREISVREDPPRSPQLLKQRLRERESEALSGSLGLRRMAEIKLEPGAHRLRVDVSLRGREDGALEPLRRAQAHLEVTMGEQSLAYEVLYQPERMGGGSLSLRPLESASAAVKQREAAYLLAMGQAASAAALRGESSVPESAGGSVLLEDYNRAMALFAAGSADAGIAALGKLGEPDDDDNADMRRLRDQANLALGSELLRREQYAAAASAFERVYVNGRYANRALLGLGWARLGGASKPEAERALRPWLELVGRDAADPAVQEGVLAIASALRQLGAQKQSEEFGRRAIRELGGARSGLQRSRALLERGDWLAVLAEFETGKLPSALERSLMQDAPAAAWARLQSLQELRQLAQATPLAAQVDAALAAQQETLRAALMQALNQEQASTERHLALAHLTLARVYDGVPPGAPAMP